MERAGMTAAECLQFAIRFAQTDLETLRPGDWLNLSDDLLGFLLSGDVERWEHAPGRLASCSTSGGVITIPNAFTGEPDISHDDFRALQAETGAILATVVQTRTELEYFKALSKPPSTDIRFRSLVVSLQGLNHPKSRNALLVSGAPRDLFIFKLQHLLILEPTNRILKCPECGKIFYRIRKQRYCSRPCSNRATVRNWRKEKRVKQVEAERAHARYTKKKRHEVGQRVVITRRPRKRSTSHAETPRQ